MKSASTREEGVKDEKVGTVSGEGSVRDEEDAIEVVGGDGEEGAGGGDEDSVGDGDNEDDNDGHVEEEWEEGEGEKDDEEETGGFVFVGLWGYPYDNSPLFNHRGYGGVKKIIISHDQTGVHSIRVQYIKNGVHVWTDQIGESEGYQIHEVIFDDPDEYLTMVTGHYGPSPEFALISSLTFVSNQKKFGPFGFVRGTPFRVTGGKIVGLVGKGSNHVTAIGFYLRCFDPSLPPFCHTCGNSRVPRIPIEQQELEIYQLQKNSVSTSCIPGPWGGNGGQPWDDGVFAGIRQIILYSRKSVVESIQIEYHLNGGSSWSLKHGGSGDIRNQIEFDYPSEYLVRVTGYHAPSDTIAGTQVIKSLTIYTNKARYGPIGGEHGCFFSSSTTPCRIVGFFGRSGLHLHAIGIHAVYP